MTRHILRRDTLRALLRPPPFVSYRRRSRSRGYQPFLTPFGRRPLVSALCIHGAEPPKGPARFHHTHTHIGYVHIHLHYVCVCIYIYIYIYIYDTQTHLSLSLYIYIYIYIYWGLHEPLLPGVSPCRVTSQLVENFLHLIRLDVAILQYIKMEHARISEIYSAPAPAPAPATAPAPLRSALTRYIQYDKMT